MAIDGHHPQDSAPSDAPIANRGIGICREFMVMSVKGQYGKRKPKDVIFGIYQEME